MPKFRKNWWLLVIPVALGLFEVINRLEYRASSEGVDVKIVNMQAYSPTRANWKVYEGSVLLRVDYSKVVSSSTSDVTKIVVSGVASIFDSRFSDNRKEVFSKICEPRFTTQPVVVDSNGFATELPIGFDPVCFVLLDHSLAYLMEEDGTVVDFDGQGRQMLVDVLKTKIDDLDIAVYTRKRPTILEKTARAWINKAYEWVSYPFRRI